MIEHHDRLGYEEAWIGEHHSGEFEIIAGPAMFIAAAAERTKRIGYLGRNTSARAAVHHGLLHP